MEEKNKSCYGSPEVEIVDLVPEQVILKDSGKDTTPNPWD